MTPGRLLADGSSITSAPALLCHLLMELPGEAVPSPVKCRAVAIRLTSPEATKLTIPRFSLEEGRDVDSSLPPTPTPSEKLQGRSEYGLTALIERPECVAISFTYLPKTLC